MKSLTKNTIAPLKFHIHFLKTYLKINHSFSCKIYIKKSFWNQNFEFLEINLHVIKILILKNVFLFLCKTRKKISQITNVCQKGGRFVKNKEKYVNLHIFIYL